MILLFFGGRRKQAAKKYDFDERCMNSSSFFTIVHLSDFHYDFEYAEGSSSDCIEEMCCRNTSTVSGKFHLKCSLIIHQPRPLNFKYYVFYFLMMPTQPTAKREFNSQSRLLGRFSCLRFAWILNRKYLLTSGY